MEAAAIIFLVVIIAVVLLIIGVVVWRYFDRNSGTATREGRGDLSGSECKGGSNTPGQCTGPVFDNFARLYKVFEESLNDLKEDVARAIKLKEIIEKTQGCLPHPWGGWNDDMARLNSAFNNLFIEGSKPVCEVRENFQSILNTVRGFHGSVEHVVELYSQNVEAVLSPFSNFGPCTTYFRDSHNRESGGKIMDDLLGRSGDLQETAITMALTVGIPINPF